MALKMNLAESPLGVPMADAYARVLNVHLDKEKARVMVEVHASEAARKAGARPVDHRMAQLDVAALKGDILPAVYAALKALPEYAAAVDC